MDPIVSEKHSCEENELEHTVVCHACAVALAMNKPLEEEETLLEASRLSTVLHYWRLAGYLQYYTIGG
jgi:hypothetical protein